MLFIKSLFFLFCGQSTPLIMMPDQFGYGGAEKFAKTFHSFHLLIAQDGHRKLSDRLDSKIVSVELV